MGCHQPGPFLCSHLIIFSSGSETGQRRTFCSPPLIWQCGNTWQILVNASQDFKPKANRALLWKCGIGTGQWAVEQKLHEQFCQIFDPSNHDKGWGQWRVHLQTTWQIRCLISILTKNTCSQRSYMETKGWDVFRSLPPETDSSSEAVDKWLGTTVKILKVRENLQSD